MSRIKNEIKIWQQIDKDMTYQLTTIDLNEPPLELMSSQTMYFYDENRILQLADRGLKSFKQNINNLD